MSDISKISLPSSNGGTPTIYNIKDANAQPKTLATPIDVDGTTYTTVEETLAAINDKEGASIGMNTVDSENVMLLAANEL